MIIAGDGPTNEERAVCVLGEASYESVPTDEHEISYFRLEEGGDG
ncbi:MAG: hypothetical protein AAF558_04895 [Verrucomicrobiota bacterium]